jgi:hypothetical protein
VNTNGFVGALRSFGSLALPEIDEDEDDDEDEYD